VEEDLIDPKGTFVLVLSHFDTHLWVGEHRKGDYSLLGYTNFLCFESLKLLEEENKTAELEQELGFDMVAEMEIGKVEVEVELLACRS